MSLISGRVVFPCQLECPNRLVKAPMEELLACFRGGPPLARHLSLYRKWAEGGFGMIITGNVFVSNQLGTPFNVVIPPDPTTSDYAKFKAWSNACFSPATAEKRPLGIIQLNHPGRQCTVLSRPFFTSSLSPSGLNISDSAPTFVSRCIQRLAFGATKEMTRADIKNVIGAFRRSARFVKDCGWDGVEVHAAHGYLLAQFLDPKSNKRTDEYGGSVENRARLLLEIVKAIREEIPITEKFCVGFKINSADFVDGGMTEDDAEETIRLLVLQGGVDFIEISGGSYEKPIFMQELDCQKARTFKREAFFQSFSIRAHAMLNFLNLGKDTPKIILTGGFRTLEGMQSALSTPQATDLIGIARPACLDPSFALSILSSSESGSESVVPSYSIPRMDGWIYKAVMAELWMPSVSLMYHCVGMKEIARERVPNRNIGFVGAVGKFLGIY